MTPMMGILRLSATRSCNARIALCHWDMKETKIMSLGGKQKKNRNVLMAATGH